MQSSGLNKMILLLFLFFLNTEAVNPGCDCILYTATYGKEYGIFSSPDFPKPYPPKIKCLLYTFLAASDEIIEIQFKEFDVDKTNTDCLQGDYLKLFLHVEDAEVNEYTPWSSLLCGKYNNVPHVFFSSGPGLVLEFHTDGHHTTNSSGFIGTFRFLEKKMFHTDGHKLAGTSCDYQFISNNHTRPQGRFFSPRYPSNYPPDIKCAYTFRARAQEKIRVILEDIKLEEGDVSCINRADYIKVHDGRTASYPAIGLYCNQGSHIEILSTGPELYIEFVSHSVEPGQGFKAKFQFQNDHSSKSTKKIHHHNIGSPTFVSSTTTTSTTTSTVPPVTLMVEDLDLMEDNNDTTSTIGPVTSPRSPYIGIQVCPPRGRPSTSLTSA
uniref:Dorsal-ventral patterning protein tolloid n=1 Tax=Cacopsylla melanoneura TaxID=428564 RepID=A0A8D8Z1K3_9HEMI